MHLHINDYASGCMPITLYLFVSHIILLILCLHYTLITTPTTWGEQRHLHADMIQIWYIKALLFALGRSGYRRMAIFMGVLGNTCYYSEISLQWPLHLFIVILRVQVSFFLSRLSTSRKMHILHCALCSQCLNFTAKQIKRDKNLIVTSQQICEMPQPNISRAELNVNKCLHVLVSSWYIKCILYLYYALYYAFTYLYWISNTQIKI